MFGRSAARCLAALTAVLAAAGTARASRLWQDRPLKIIQTADAHFPAALAMRGIREAEVRAVIHVDADGKLVDCLVTAYSHPELVREILAHVREWRYQPALQRGEPIGTRTEIAFKFESRGAVLSLTPVDLLTTNLNRLMATPLTWLTCTLADLDQPPALIHVVDPQHPGKGLRPAQPHGSVSVDFYIDAEGRPRMPIITRASHEAFALAALDALTQWRFAPPTRAGQPVIVRVVQQFVFGERT